MQRFSVIVTLITAAFSQITLPPFRQIAHDIQSGPIEVTNNDTLHISNFYFDGKAPRAHFWVGKGQPSTNGTLVPFPRGATALPSYSNINITLQLPNKTITDIDYLSVWCEDAEMSLGHVFTNERWVVGKNGTTMILPKTVGPFRKTKHEISSGNIVLMNESSIFIPNFNYNGTGNSARFYLGGNPSFLDGKFLSSLSKHNNEDVTLVLENSTLGNFNYLAILDFSNVSLGHVYFSDTPNIMETYMGNQYDGFENAQYRLKSGPIILVNKNSVYITNFQYKGFGNEYFWTGSVRKAENEGFAVPNQAGVLSSINKDNGSSFYLTLPKLPANELKYFGIWDNETSVLLAKITFLDSTKDVPAKITKDGKKIIRYPKCCRHGEMMYEKGCGPTNLLLDNSIPVHYANSTHLNDDPMIPDRVIFVPFFTNLSCDRYYLDPTEPDDKFLYLTSGTLLFPANQAHYNQEDFCLDLINSDGDVYHTAFICHRNYSMAEGIRIAISVCVALSSISLFFTAVSFFIITDKDDMRGASIAGFSGFMGIAFACLFFTQIGIESVTTCNVLGIIFQFFIVSSLIWLVALCYEMNYNIRNFDKDSILDAYKKRLTWYSVLAVAFPLIFVIISLIFGIPAGLINVNLDKNCFLEVSNKKWLLYSPILLTIVIAIALTCYNYHLYRRNQQRSQSLPTGENNWWKFVKGDIKTSNEPPYLPQQALMLCVFLVLFTSFCWFFEIVTYAFESSWEPLDFVHAFQGVFTMIIVLSTGNIWKKLMARTCSRTPTSRTSNATETELQPMNKNGNATS